MIPARILHGMIGLAGCWALGACGASGKAWVQEPESGFTAADPANVPKTTLADLESAPAPVAMAEPEQNVDAPRTRLDHVVSLGDGAAAGPSGAGDAAGASPYGGGPVVNIYNVVQPNSLGYGYGYAGYGYAGYGHARGGYGRGGYGDAGGTRPSQLPATSSSPSTPALGGSWQPPPSHGPAFPYSTAPASPWERSR